MQYRRCKCGKAERWDSGETVHACQGCTDCQTTYAQHPEDHEPLQPHVFADYYLGGNTPNPAKRCVNCNHIERPQPTPAD